MLLVNMTTFLSISLLATILGFFTLTEVRPYDYTRKPQPNWEKIAVENIKKFESFRPIPYYCPAGVLTIGYGTTGEKLKNIGYITESTALKYLKQDLEKAKQAVFKHVKVNINQHQIWALTSFTHNCGEGSLIKLVNGKNRLNSGNYQSVPRLLPLYCKADGQTLNGLRKRRAWEARIWNNQI